VSADRWLTIRCRIKTWLLVLGLVEDHYEEESGGVEAEGRRGT